MATSVKPSFYRRKIRPYILAVMSDAYSLYDNIRVKLMETYYVLKLGVAVKELPEDVIGKIHFPKGAAKGLAQSVVFANALLDLSKALGIDFKETHLSNCYAALLQKRFELVKMIAEVEPIFTMTDQEIRTYVLSKMIEHGEYNPMLTELTNRGLFKRIQRWVFTGEMETPDNNN